MGALLASHSRTLPSRTIWLLGSLGAIGLVAATIDGAAMWGLLRDGYMLLLALSALCLLLAFEQRQRLGGWRPWRTFNWLRSWGRLSYEIYLTHMFVVMAVVWLFRLGGSDFRLGLVWYAVTLPLCWFWDGRLNVGFPRPATAGFGSNGCGPSRAATGPDRQRSTGSSVVSRATTIEPRQE